MMGGAIAAALKPKPSSSPHQLDDINQSIGLQKTVPISFGAGQRNCDFFRTHADVGIIAGTANSLIWIGLTRLSEQAFISPEFSIWSDVASRGPIRIHRQARIISETSRSVGLAWLGGTGVAPVFFTFQEAV